MPIGIVETALVISAATGAYNYAKRTGRRRRRRNFFKQQQTDEYMPPAAPIEAEPSDDAPPPAVMPDDLEKIWGIGPIYVERLHKAGINSYAALANATPDQLRDIAAPSDNAPAPDVTVWIEQVAQFATAEES